MRCTRTQQELTQEEVSMHNQVKRRLGQFPPDTYLDENGDLVVVERFVDKLISYLKHARFDFDFSMNGPICGQITTVPRVKDFADVLWKVRNIVLSRLIVITEACANHEHYRHRYMEKPCFDGTVKPFVQACNYFMEQYTKIDAHYTTLLARFDRINTKTDYLDVLNDMLDWRYTKENRRPVNAPWQCWPMAQIHEDDVGMFP